jgi:iron(III) transport system substrate-binding protein
LAQSPPAEAITPTLINAARQEGKVNLYTAMEIAVAERYARIFETKYPGIRVRLERSGAERIFSRIAQEYASRIFSVDLVNTTDAAHALAWKRANWLAPYLPEDAAQYYAPGHIDPDGTFVTLRILFSAIAYNTELVKTQDAPKGFMDLLDTKWSGRLVKAHPGYSGLILTATHAMARELGWTFFERLAAQRVMQVQSGVDPPRKVALGERAVSVDGADYIALEHKDRGEPIELVYPTEGAPLINSPSAVFRAAPNPNAARLLQNWMCSLEGQQALVDLSGQYVPHASAKPRPGRRPLAEIKAMREDPAAVLEAAEAIKARYAAIFKV